MADKVIQCGYMSGDMYGAASCLILYPDFHIFLIKDTKEPQDKTGQIQKFYNECGLGGRFTTIDITDQTLAVKTFWKAIFEKRKTNAGAPTRPVSTSSELDRMLYRLYADCAPRNKWPLSITAVTGLVGKKWNEDPGGTGNAIARAWRVGKLATDMKFALYEYMGGKFSKINFDIRGNIVVLWSRQSGKRGGAHVELDSSYTGIRQLARYFATTQGSATVLLAGDEQSTKLGDLANQHAQVINVSQMWEDKFWKEGAFAGATFLAQFAFFKYLADDYKVIHVGMRSGMLESMALMGMSVFYMEPSGSPSGARMLAFSQAGIPYTRIEIESPPGVTARIVNDSIEKKPSAPRTPSLEGFQGSLNFHTERILGQQIFLKFNGNWNDKARKYVQHEHSRARAELFAKAKMLGLQPDYSLGRGIYDYMDRQRGFLERDMEKIVKQIESKFTI